jgi:hypothetical protein
VTSRNTPSATRLNRDRKTVRAYLNGTRTPGVRASSRSDPLEPFTDYLTARFADDPHVWASALHDEVQRLGYVQSYPAFTRQVRLAGLRPHCEACRGVKGRDTIEIDHPAGEEIQWDWFERRNAPWGGTAYVLLGTLPHSGRVRGVLSEKMDHAHLVSPRGSPGEFRWAGSSDPRNSWVSGRRLSSLTQEDANAEAAVVRIRTRDRATSREGLFEN